jgi:UDP-galactopyranose mutase
VKVLIVGAGFSGAVYARTLAEAGLFVDVIDKRHHIGGNAYDFVDQNGVRVHAYGPHLFHTKSRRILDWISRFGAFVPYCHRVRALLPNGQYAPMPINLDTVNIVSGSNFQTADEVDRYLSRVAQPISEPRNAAEYLYSKIGMELTDLFFRPYTKKMWALDLEDMASAVVKRIPLRTDRTDTYFSDDEIQVLPKNGYTELFRNILDHSSIRVKLDVAFDKAILKDYSHCFNSMPIDEYFGFKLGELPYRSIRFHTRTEASGSIPGWSVTNFTDMEKFTRETNWDALPHHRITDTDRRTITKEEPCDYRDNVMERYYPVKTADGRFQALYEKYRELGQNETKMSFIGRCGTYQYLDMDQVINQSLAGAERWLLDNELKPVPAHLNK